MATVLKHIKLSDIYEPEIALRKCDRNDEKYLELVESIKLKGVLDSICVRELEDEGKYGLVNGLQRYTACKDVGLDSIPCQVISCEEADVLESQIIANVHKVEMKPYQYSKGLVEIIVSNPMLSRAELAGKLAKTESWLSERLGLLRLTEEIGKLVDSGKIKLSNAYALAKLEPEEQVNYADRAMVMPPQQFNPTCNARIKELKAAKKKGKDAAPEEFQPIAMLRSRADIVNEIANYSEMDRLINGCTSMQDAFVVALKWTLNLDSQSAEMQQAKDKERKDNRKRQNEKAAAERTRKRSEKAAETAAKLKVEAEKLEGQAV